MAHLQTRFLYLLLATIILLVSSNPINAASIGKVTEQSGPTEIVRNKKSTPSSVNASVELNDTVITAAAKTQLTFTDATSVKISEQSKLVIDDFVFDPNKGTGKLAMKVALGTARYASGQIAKNSPQTVNIQTPTARIAVRGTDFSMTVDEMGRSLVMLLPSCDLNSCVTGAISVSNDAGTVHMDVAYQVTYVTSINSMPSSPLVVTLDQANINNYLIVSSPIKTYETDVQSKETKNALDFNFLNKDFLKYDELEKNELDSIRALDINYLDGNLLVNMLDLANQQLFASFETLAGLNQLLPNYAPELTGIRYFLNDDESKISLLKSVKHTAIVTLSVEQNATVYINQDGVNVFQRVNSGGAVNISVIQR